ncbi:unnamed protein product [Gordionus sp. m RMFG-2023]
MSYCEQKGKDKITYVTKADHSKLPELDENTKKALFEDDDESSKGLISPDGTINWNCPCLGNMASGPCADKFMEAFTCFHESTAEVKGSDCLEKFSNMQSCFQQYPKLYGDYGDGESTMSKDLDGDSSAGLASNKNEARADIVGQNKGDSETNKTYSSNTGKSNGDKKATHEHNEGNLDANKKSEPSSGDTKNSTDSSKPKGNPANSSKLMSLF